MPLKISTYIKVPIYKILNTITVTHEIVFAAQKIHSKKKNSYVNETLQAILTYELSKFTPLKSTEF
jgi:hypothetical protein